MASVTQTSGKPTADDRFQCIAPRNPSARELVIQPISSILDHTTFIVVL
jgi:hypothetical protein